MTRSAYSFSSESIPILQNHPVRQVLRYFRSTSMHYDSLFEYSENPRRSHEMD